MVTPFFQGTGELQEDRKFVLSVQCDLILEQTGARRQPTTGVTAYAQGEIKGTITTALNNMDLTPYMSSNSSPDNLDLKLSDGQLLHVTWLEANGEVSCSPK